MLPEFSSLKPGTKSELLSRLASFPDAAVLAGGTDLLVRMKKGETHAHVIDITGVADLRGISDENGLLRLGPTTTHSEVSSNRGLADAAASLFTASGLVGSPQIRNMGTIGGNIVNASPAADTIAPLLIHDAVVTLESEEGTRSVEFNAFITQPYKTVIKRNEILSSIALRPLRGYEEGYRRVAKRAAFAISRLSLAWAISEKGGVFEDVRLAIGSCTPMPFRPFSAEEFLRGQKKEQKVINEAVNMVLEEIRRITAERPSFAYKLPVVKGLLREVLGGAPCCS